MVEVRQYVDAFGRDHFERWFCKLDAVTQSRVVVAVDRIERGSFSAAKSVGSGVLELKLDFGPGYRIYFGKDGDRLVILLAGGTKQRQQEDIVRAHALWKDYKLRKREG